MSPLLSQLTVRIGLGNSTLGNGSDWEEKLGESRVSEQQMESEKGLEVPVSLL